MTIKLSLNDPKFRMSGNDADLAKKHMAAAGEPMPSHASTYKGSIEIRMVLHGVFPYSIQEVLLPYKHVGSDGSICYTGEYDVNFMYDLMTADVTYLPTALQWPAYSRTYT